MNEAEAGWSGHAVVELFGHKRMAGFVSSETIGAATFVRIDVPATEPREGERAPATKGYTKFLGSASIYGITPCEEATALRAAREIERYNEPLPVSLPAFPALAGNVGSDVEFYDDQRERPFQP